MQAYCDILHHLTAEISVVDVSITGGVLEHIEDIVKSVDSKESPTVKASLYTWIHSGSSCRDLTTTPFSVWTAYMHCSSP
jgi:hypothetical protein